MNPNNSEYSDTSDDDYVPGGAPAGGIPSENSTDGVSEEPLSEADDLITKRSKHQKILTKRRPKVSKDTSSTSNSAAADSTCANSEIKADIVQDEKKKHADDLWASFKRDTGFKKKETLTETKVKPSAEVKADTKRLEPKVKSAETVKVTQFFEFAGEAVSVEKEVKADSAEARLHGPQSSQRSTPNDGPPKRKAGLSGIGSVLRQRGKKQKLSTLEKTKLDWNQYKQRENIVHELESYKKGKDGYLDKQDFLQRADQRQFEIERDVRTIERNKRINNTP